MALIHEKNLKSKILYAGIEGILCTVQSSYCTDSAAYTYRHARWLSTV
jgi:hypothetical protein